MRDPMSALDWKSGTISETKWRIIILITCGLVILFSFWCLYSGLTTVFPNLFYFPIILLAFRYRKTGVLYSALMGLVYLIMIFYFQYSNFSEIIGALLRFLSFIAVAAVIAYLSNVLGKRTTGVPQHQRVQRKYHLECKCLACRSR